MRRANTIGKSDKDFLYRLAAEDVGERLEATNREFKICADLFSPFDCMGKISTGHPRIGELHRIIALGQPKPNGPMALQLTIAAKTEQLPLADGVFDLITSIGGLHWSNDLPGSFALARRALKPDGLFLAALPGERTLIELRQCLLQAETEITGAAALRVEPFAEIRQLGGLLQRAGFALPVADTQVICARYSSFQGLVDDLRAMGATRSLKEAVPFISKEVFERTKDLYKERFSDPDGKLRASFEIVQLSGWAPDPSQQKPLKPGSAEHKLIDFL